MLTERERTAAGCYSYHKMRAEPQKGSAPFPASGAPHSCFLRPAPLGLGPGSPLPHAMGMGVAGSPVPVHWVPTPSRPLAWGALPILPFNCTSKATTKVELMSALVEDVNAVGDVVDAAEEGSVSPARSARTIRRFLIRVVTSSPHAGTTLLVGSAPRLSVQQTCWTAAGQGSLPRGPSEASIARALGFTMPTPPSDQGLEFGS